MPKLFIESAFCQIKFHVDLVNAVSKLVYQLPRIFPKDLL